LEEFVPCESHQADYDFALIYAEFFGNTGRWARLHVDGKGVQERVLLAYSFFSV
jgi:hypothetical protein